jgi:hypothetical protein
MLTRVVAPAVVRSPAAVDVPLTTAEAVRAHGPTPTDQFEAQVFRFLVTSQRALGLREVHRFQNQLLDGALVLTNGARVVLEVKYRLGWDTACRSNWQIEWFLRRHPRERRRYRYGLVIFGAFSGDWGRARHGMDAGWDHWYRGHAGFHGRRIRIGLAQFADNQLVPYPKARVTRDRAERSGVAD